MFLIQDNLHYCFLDTILRTICCLPSHKQEEYHLTFSMFFHQRLRFLFMNIHECANDITVIYVHDTRNMPSGINSGKAPCQTMMVWTFRSYLTVYRLFCYA